MPVIMSEMSSRACSAISCLSRTALIFACTAGRTCLLPTWSLRIAAAIAELSCVCKASRWVASERELFSSLISSRCFCCISLTSVSMVAVSLSEKYCWHRACSIWKPLPLLWLVALEALVPWLAPTPSSEGSRKEPRSRGSQAPDPEPFSTLTSDPDRDCDSPFRTDPDREAEADPECELPRSSILAPRSTWSRPSLTTLPVFGDPEPDTASRPCPTSARLRVSSSSSALALRTGLAESLPGRCCRS
mmetsp:Transcript_46408/g.120033  ORF Transcript_46408/g.120033 Transcript_46408/m.120033 type:complete len:247 (+) Transcript_46408:2327-3067(+)